MMNFHRTEYDHVKTLPELYTDFFSLVLHMRSISDYGNAENLRGSLTGHFDELEKAGRDLKFQDNDLIDAKFALTAFLDETILNSAWNQKEKWRRRPLQLDYFKTNNAGKEFFERLKRIRKNSDDKSELLELYYLCLILGFEGKFKHAGREELRETINDITDKLRKNRLGADERISPHGYPPEESMRWSLISRLPSWVVVSFCAGIALLSILLIYYSQ